MTMKPSPSEQRPRLGDTLFAIVHVLLLSAILIYGLVSIVLGNIRRAVVILGCLALYYLLVLHKPLIKEVRRRRSLKSASGKIHPKK